MALHGYTRMFENVLSHPGITILLNKDYRAVDGFITYQEMSYTGPTAEFFNFR